MRPATTRSPREHRRSMRIGNSRTMTIQTGPRAPDRIDGWVLALSAGLAMLLAYFFDPDRGRSRRAQSADELGGLARRLGREFGRRARYTGATAAGIGERLTHST